MSFLLGPTNHRYQWIDRWAVIPDAPSGRSNGRTHGVVVSEHGEILVFHQANPAILVFDQSGKLLDAWGDRFAGAHGMTIVREGASEFLWLTDQDSGEVVKTTLVGKTVLSIPKPPHPVYRNGTYSPTWVAVNEVRHGGNGDIWVADGYGMSWLHRFDSRGNYLSSTNGEQGFQRFSCPHGLMFDFRNGTPELYVADRGNKQFQVLDAEGNFLRAIGGNLELPCGSALSGDELVVPELNARLTILDARDGFICHLGANEATCEVEGWPNHPPGLIVPGKFNSPHAAAVDGQGNIFVVEWIIGGRITKLRKVTN